MSEISWKEIGKVKEAHGLRGDLYILVFSGDVSWLGDLTQVQVGKDSFEIEKAKVFKKGLIVKLKGIENRNQSEAVEGLLFSIPQELLVSQPGETIFLKEILHFKVKDKGQMVGEVIGFSSNTAQDLLQVQTENGIFEVPFVEDFILNIDFEAKTLEMDLPEGLLE